MRVFYTDLGELWKGDCLELMKDIPDKSVDMILCDLPYEVTARQKWDVIIPFEKLWDRYSKVIKDCGAIVLFATEPFRSKLISSNYKLFKYDLIWVKNKTTGFLNAKKQPLRKHESVLVFYKKKPKYNPQKTVGHKPVNNFSKTKGEEESFVYGKTKPYSGGGSTERYPTSILEFSVVNNDSLDKFHSAQKPIDLFEYLIKTYTNEGDLVLDNCSGSGTTGLACENLGRKWICIEKEEKYIKATKTRFFYKRHPELTVKIKSRFKLGQKVKYQGEIHEIHDIDEGYGYLALSGDKYISPNHEENRCISAPMNECEKL